MNAPNSELPTNWTLEETEEGIRLVPPTRVAGGALILMLILFAVDQFAPPPGAWWPTVWIPLSIVCGFRFLLSLPQREWWLGKNSLEIRRTYSGRSQPEVKFRDASLTASLSIGEYWSLQVCDAENVRVLQVPDSLEEFAQVAEIVSAYTGWNITSADGSTALLRELLRRALDLRNAERLGVLLKDEQAAAALVLLWRSRPATSRASVAELLGRTTDCKELLLKVVKCEDPQTRAAAVDLLGELADDSVIPNIRVALSDPNETVRTRAATVLGRLQDRHSVPPLCTALSYGGDFPLTAAWALGEIRDPSAVPELSTILNSGGRLAEGDLRRTAAIALGRIGDQSAAAVLCAALSDLVSSVREGAAQALGELGCPSAVPALRTALADTEETVVLEAIAALGKLQASSAVPELGECLRHKSTQVRANALHALGGIGGDVAATLLCGGLLDRSAEVRRSAAQALTSFAEACEDAPVLLRSAVALLQKMCARLSTERGDVKRACAIALTQIERRTASVKDLPLPAALGEHSAATLPRSVEPVSETNRVESAVPSLRRLR